MAEPRIRQILVALDASPLSLAALDCALAWAEALEAEILGLFVEDADLLATADLPITAAVDASSARLRPLEPPEVERQLRAQARRARAALAARASGSPVRWSFRTIRGAVTGELLAAARGADLVALGRSGWPAAFRRGPGATAQAMVQLGPVPVLVLPRGWRPGRPVLVLVDASPAAMRALDLATRLAPVPEGALEVVVTGPPDAPAHGPSRAGAAGLGSGDGDPVEQLASLVRDRLAAQGVRARVQSGPADLDSLAETVWALSAGLLVLPATSPLAPAVMADRRLPALGCAVLVAR